MAKHLSPLGYIDKVTTTLKGLERSDSWKVYLATGFLLMAISLLLLTVAVWRQYDVRLQEAISPHETPAVQRELKQPKQEQAAPVIADKPPRKVIEEVEEQMAGQVDSDASTAAARQIEPVEPSSGQWFYDEVYKDWRFKKH